MKRAAVIIGAGFGDEGKGLLTDCEAFKRRPRVTVVRFNGGAQAGHTVELQSGLRHVFHHFGSGTMAGAHTYLGPEFIVNPTLFLDEARSLKSFSNATRISCHPKALVTTPFDMYLNQAAEIARGRRRHGSCGVGIGETVERSNADPRFLIRAEDLRHETVIATRLTDIQNEWFPARAKALGVDLSTDTIARDLHAAGAILFKRECIAAGHRLIISDTIPDDQEIVFEGAQGLLLDQDHKFFPHVTRSHTGLDNVLALAEQWDLPGLDITYVTRAYLTRHGAGPMPTETAVKPYAGIVDHTNIPHPFQETLRFGFLDLDLMTEAIKNDLNKVGPWAPRIDASITMTCVDHVGLAPFFWTRRNRTNKGSFGALCTAIREATGLAVTRASRGPTREFVTDVMENAPIRHLA